MPRTKNNNNNLKKKKKKRTGKYRTLNIIFHCQRARIILNVILECLLKDILFSRATSVNLPGKFKSILTIT